MRDWRRCVADVLRKAAPESAWMHRARVANFQGTGPESAENPRFDLRRKETGGGNALRWSGNWRMFRATAPVFQKLLKSHKLNDGFGSCSARYHVYGDHFCTAYCAFGDDMGVPAPGWINLAKMLTNAKSAYVQKASCNFFYCNPKRTRLPIETEERAGPAPTVPYRASWGKVSGAAFGRKS